MYGCMDGGDEWCSVGCKVDPFLHMYHHYAVHSAQYIQYMLTLMDSTSAKNASSCLSVPSCGGAAGADDGAAGVSALRPSTDLRLLLGACSGSAGAAAPLAASTSICTATCSSCFGRGECVAQDVWEITCGVWWRVCAHHTTLTRSRMSRIVTACYSVSVCECVNPTTMLLPLLLFLFVHCCSQHANHQAPITVKTFHLLSNKQSSTSQLTMFHIRYSSAEKPLSTSVHKQMQLCSQRYAFFSPHNKRSLTNTQNHHRRTHAPSHTTLMKPLQCQTKSLVQGIGTAHLHQSQSPWGLQTRFQAAAHGRAWAILLQSARSPPQSPPPPCQWP